MKETSQSRSARDTAWQLAMAADERSPASGDFGFCLEWLGHPDSGDGRTHFLWFHDRDSFLDFLDQHLVNFIFSEDEDVDADALKSLREKVNSWRSGAGIPEDVQTTLNDFVSVAEWRLPWAGSYAALQASDIYHPVWLAEVEARRQWSGGSFEESGSVES